MDSYSTTNYHIYFNWDETSLVEGHDKGEQAPSLAPELKIRLQVCMDSQKSNCVSSFVTSSASFCSPTKSTLRITNSSTRKVTISSWSHSRFRRLYDVVKRSNPFFLTLGFASVCWFPREVHLVILMTFATLVGGKLFPYPHLLVANLVHDNSVI